jgi:hypothetical protein
MSEAEDIILFFRSLRWKDREGYTFNKTILFVSNVCLILWIPLLALTNPQLLYQHNQPLLHCPNYMDWCENPLYGKCTEWYCNMKRLPGGYKNYEDPNIIYYITPLAWFTFLLGPYILNHLIYNKGRRFWLQKGVTYV